MYLFSTLHLGYFESTCMNITTAPHLVHTEPRSFDVFFIPGCKSHLIQYLL